MRKPKALIPAKALFWSSQISTMSIELALLIGLGYWIDLRQGTSPWFLLAGCAAGFMALAWQLYRLVHVMSRNTNSLANPRRESELEQDQEPDSSTGY